MQHGVTQRLPAFLADTASDTDLAGLGQGVIEAGMTGRARAADGDGTRLALLHGLRGLAVRAEEQLVPAAADGLVPPVAVHEDTGFPS